MDSQSLNLSDEQLKFLSVLYALEKPVSLETAGKLSPILPAPFMELLGHHRHPALIREIGKNLFSISPDLPKPLKKRIDAFNNSRRLSEIVDRLLELDMIDHIDSDVVRGLLNKTGRITDIAELEINQARKALKSGDQHLAMHHLWNVVKKLYEISEDPRFDRMFISATLKLSDLCLSLGTGFMELPRFLKKARSMAGRLGDRRSHALINLNLSIFLHIARQHEDASKALSEGLAEVEELGDEDILNRSAAFLGLNFFLKGMFREAEPYLERANIDFEMQGGESMSLGPLPMPFLLGWCVANLGHFHDAVGGLASSMRVAARRSQNALATTIRAILGAVLQMAGKYKEAAFQLDMAKKEALRTSNTFAITIAEGSLIFQRFIEGRIDEARTQMERPAIIGGTDGFARLYTAPHILEMIFEMEARGLPVNPRLNLKSEIEWIQKAPNIHAKGAAYRILAKSAFRRNDSLDLARSHLKKSKKYLEQSGDPIEKSKTQLELVRLKILENKMLQARLLAESAYDTLLQHDLEFMFPEDLSQLLDRRNESEKTVREYRSFVARCFTVFEFETVGDNANRILSRILKYACRLLKAERGAVFKVDPPSGENVRLRTGYNMTDFDVSGEDFSPVLEVMQNAVKTQSARRFEPAPGDEDTRRYPYIREMICLPVVKYGRVADVYYFDNTYLENRFHLLDDRIMTRLTRFLDDHIEQFVEFEHLKKETSIRSSAQTVQIEQLQREALVFKSKGMTRLLAEVEQVAATDTTVLIQGETGVGKEVLARQIHRISPRKPGPFEVVDLTAIPENLLESELFGYEKGAFTGADQQKRGRIELAHNGTLLLDEIGEIPPAFQVKLLRFLQEKTFVRVGGTRTLTSDFRLVAATNRELEKEVTEERFRQDLFYRLNMMPIRIPPLRERIDDIVVIARHYLSQYAVKYGKEGLSILPDDMEALTRYPWPGNVRELKNVLERAVLLSSNGKMDFAQLKAGQPVPQTSEDNAPKYRLAVPDRLLGETPSLEELERRYIRHILEKTNGKIGGKGGAGDLLGMKRTTLYSRMRKLGIHPHKIH
ncbi:MAG: sigma 54-interacting transcriptional regulator [Desulfobacterales bacterium]